MYMPSSSMHVFRCQTIVIGHFLIYHNTLCLSLQIWQWSQENTKTRLMQNLEGQTKNIMVVSKVAYWRFLPIDTRMRNQRVLLCPGDVCKLGLVHSPVSRF